MDFPTSKQYAFPCFIISYDGNGKLKLKRKVMNDHVHQGMKQESENSPYQSVEESSWSGWSPALTE